MRHFTPILALPLALSCASPALAGWQGVEFGDGPAQVSARFPDATRNDDRARDKPGLKAEMRMPYAVGALTTTAYFLFDASSGLAEIDLSLAGASECASLQGVASATYGPPETTSRTEFIELMRWRDTANGNLVFFLQIGETDPTCSVQYKPIPKPGAAGGL